MICSINNKVCLEVMKTYQTLHLVVLRYTVKLSSSLHYTVKLSSSLHYTVKLSSSLIF